MAIGETAKLVASLELDASKFNKGVGQASKGLNTLSTRTIAAGTAIGVGLERLAEKGLSALGGAIGEGIQGALTLEKAQAQTQAVITSTGNAAGISAQQIRDMANALEDVTTVDDKTIQQGENLLLTFTAIGKDVFPAAAKAAVDMAVALNKGDTSTADIDASALRLGKALQDPIKGLTALARAGVNVRDLKPQVEAVMSFTKEELKHWQALKKSGKAAQDKYLADLRITKTAKAQKLILAELNKEFGKAGEAAGTGFAADISRANDAIEDAKIALAQGLIPAVGEVAKVLSSTFRDPQVLTSIRGIGVGIGEAIKNVVTFIRGVDWSKVGAGIKGVFSGLSAIASGVKAAWDTIPDPLKQLLVTGIVADRTMKFLFGFSPAHFVISGVESAVSATIGKAVGAAVIGAGLGKAFVQPVFVTNQGFGAGGGLPGAAAEGAGAAAGLGLGTIIIGAAAAAVIGGVIAEAIARPVGDAIQSGLGTAADNGQMLGNRDPRRFDQYGRVIANTLGEIHRDTSPISPDIEGLRGAIIRGIDGLPAKTAAQATAIAKTAAQHDAETSSSIATLVAQQAKASDIETLRGSISTGLSPIAQTGDIETLRGSTMQGLQTVDASTFQAGATAATASRSAGMQVTGATWGAAGSVVGAIQANRPITNVTVNVSATTVKKTVDVITRYGPSGGDRDNDGGGGPGQ